MNVVHFILRKLECSTSGLLEDHTFIVDVIEVPFGNNLKTYEVLT